MAQRYARIDVDFFHKNTAGKIRERLGRDGQLVFLALILRAKDGSPAGTFSYSSEAVGWEKLGFGNEAMPFTLDEFFTVLGQLKQASRRRRGLVTDASLTRYGDWQQDSRRYEEAVRKASKRAQSAADTERTPHGTAGGHPGGTRSRSRSTPKPPLKKRKTAGHQCPRCPLAFTGSHELAEHLENVHALDPHGQPLTA
jgi:hypothetical protein